MNWQQATPWRRKQLRDKAARTAEQQLAAIEKACRAGDLSLGAAIKQAYEVGLTRKEPNGLGCVCRR